MFLAHLAHIYISHGLFRERKSSREMLSRSTSPGTVPVPGVTVKNGIRVQYVNVRETSRSFGAMIVHTF